VIAIRILDAPSVREWLPAGHLVWYLLEVVEPLDLDDLYGRVPGDATGAEADRRVRPLRCALSRRLAPSPAIFVRIFSIACAMRALRIGTGR
jgi:hypothetical protein